VGRCHRVGRTDRLFTLPFLLRAPQIPKGQKGSGATPPATQGEKGEKKGRERYPGGLRTPVETYSPETLQDSVLVVTRGSCPRRGGFDSPSCTLGYRCSRTYPTRLGVKQARGKAPRVVEPYMESRCVQPPPAPCQRDQRPSTPPGVG
jgi:hypothetical protein